MSWLELKLPPLLVAVLIAAAMVALDRLLPHLRITVPFSESFAMLLVTAGGIAGTAGILAFRRASTSLDPMRPDAVSSLVDGGIYRHTRNPMYLGIALILCALAVFLSNPAAVLGPVALVLYLTRFQIVPEERILARRFADYDAYRKRVRRWI